MSRSLAGDLGFTGFGPPTGLLHSLWGQGAFTPLALAGFLRQGDALGLALPDDGPFKLGERPQDPEHEGGPPPLAHQ